METPSEYFKNLLEVYKNENPSDSINNPPKSDFVNSGKFNEIINKMIEDGKK